VCLAWLCSWSRFWTRATRGQEQPRKYPLVLRKHQYNKRQHWCIECRWGCIIQVYPASILRNPWILGCRKLTWNRKWFRLCTSQNTDDVFAQLLTVQSQSESEASDEESNPPKKGNADAPELVHIYFFRITLMSESGSTASLIVSSDDQSWSFHKWSPTMYCVSPNGFLLSLGTSERILNTQAVFQVSRLYVICGKWGRDKDCLRSPQQWHKITNLFVCWGSYDNDTQIVVSWEVWFDLIWGSKLGAMFPTHPIPPLSTGLGGNAATAARWRALPRIAAAPRQQWLCYCRAVRSQCRAAFLSFHMHFWLSSWAFPRFSNLNTSFGC
jgi:hypothetical protein